MRLRGCKRRSKHKHQNADLSYEALNGAYEMSRGRRLPAGFTLLLGYVYPPGVHTVEERVAAFEHGPSRSFFNAVNVKAHDKGGHFGHFENPDAFVGDLRETFRKLR